MFILKSLALLFFVITSINCVAEIKTEDGVLVLTKDNFAEAISNNEFILVEFYAPLCEHCKKFAPEYVSAAHKLEKQDPNIKLGKVDATIEQDLAEQYGVKGYPTLKFFRNGNPMEYCGGRQSNYIITWLTKMSGPPAKEMTTVKQVKELVDSVEIVVLGFFENRDSDAAKNFLNVAAILDDQVFGISSAKEVFDEYNAKDGHIRLLKKFEDGKVLYDGENEDTPLIKWIKTQSLPLLVELSRETFSKVFSGGIKNHLILYLSKSGGDFEKYVDGLKPAAEKFRRNVLFVTIDTDKPGRGGMMDVFGMKKDEVPSMRLIGLEGGISKYKPEKPDLTADNVESFVADFLAGKLKQHLLSQDVPEDWNKTPVWTLVSSNFDSVAFDETKNVLVEFYSPRCGHCKSFIPIYDSLGENYANNKEVVIAKMDATANELEHTKVGSFPTIKLYTKDNKVIDYNGERTLEGLIKFIESGGDYGQSLEEAEKEGEDDDAPRKDEL